MDVNAFLFISDIIDVFKNECLFKYYFAIMKVLLQRVYLDFLTLDWEVEELDWMPKKFLNEDQDRFKGIKDLLVWGWRKRNSAPICPIGAPKVTGA